MCSTILDTLHRVHSGLATRCCISTWRSFHCLCPTVMMAHQRMKGNFSGCESMSIFTFVYRTGTIQDTRASRRLESVYFTTTTLLACLTIALSALTSGKRPDDDANIPSPDIPFLPTWTTIFTCLCLIDLLVIRFKNMTGYSLVINIQWRL